MTDMATPVVVPAARERGWWQVVIAAGLVLFVPLTPPFQILLPVDATIVLLAPALAACALVGWWSGGRLPLALLWTALAAVTLWQFAGGGGTIALLASGWAVLLAAAFGSSVVLGGNVGEAPRSMLPRALTAIALALAIVTIVATAVPGGTQSVLGALKTEAAARAQAALDVWRQRTSTPEWTDLVAQRPDAAAMSRQVVEMLQGAPRVAMLLFPSMLALESLAVLALAWAVYHRVGRARLGPPLASLREFRFSDQLVWGLIVGLVLVVVPWFAALAALGANMLVFFGVLYTVRGLGVGLWFLAPGRLVMALLLVFSLFFWRMLGALALGFGLGDTWIDWRGRARRRAERK